MQLADLLKALSQKNFLSFSSGFNKVKSFTVFNQNNIDPELFAAFEQHAKNNGVQQITITAYDKTEAETLAEAYKFTMPSYLHENTKYIQLNKTLENSLS